MDRPHPHRLKSKALFHRTRDTVFEDQNRLLSALTAGEDETDGNHRSFSRRRVSWAVLQMRTEGPPVVFRRGQGSDQTEWRQLRGRHRFRRSHANQTDSRIGHVTDGPLIAGVAQHTQRNVVDESSNRAIHKERQAHQHAVPVARANPSFAQTMSLNCRTDSGSERGCSLRIHGFIQDRPECTSSGSSVTFVFGIIGH